MEENDELNGVCAVVRGSSEEVKAMRNGLTGDPLATWVNLGLGPCLGPCFYRSWGLC